MLRGLDNYLIGGISDYSKRKDDAWLKNDQLFYRRPYIKRRSHISNKKFTYLKGRRLKINENNENLSENNDSE